MALNIDNSLGDVKAHVRPVAQEVDERWDMYNIWGFGGTQDHLLGLALDFMLYTRDGNSIRTDVGNQIAAFMVKDSVRLNISYVIWRQRIWNPSRDPANAPWSEWRLMEDRGDPTQNHMDHVHVSFKPTGVYTPPTTGGTTTPMPTIKLSETGPGKSVANNKVVQTALRSEYGTVYVDGDWGPQTKSYYTRWQNSLGFTGSDADGIPGKTSLTRLGAKYGFTVDSSVSTPIPTPTPPPAPSTGGEPAHNYTRTTYGGRTVNERTKVMLQAAAKEFGGPLTLTQGSYNKGVSASAGTHDGGGVVDINVNNITTARRTVLVQCLRRAGFAAWLRTPSQGFAYHIHACAINDHEMASAAKEQVQQYFNGQNGLAGHGADTNPPRPWPAWANKYNY